MTEVLRYEDAHAVMIWATLCTIATVIIIYFFVAYPKNKNEKSENIIGEEIEELNNTIEEINQIDDGNVKVKVIGSNNKKEEMIDEIIALFFLIIYLIVSFITMAWHITWIIWIVFAFVELIVKLIFSMKGEKSEK